MPIGHWAACRKNTNVEGPLTNTHALGEAGFRLAATPAYPTKPEKHSELPTVFFSSALFDIEDSFWCDQFDAMPELLTP